MLNTKALPRTCTVCAVLAILMSGAYSGAAEHESKTADETRVRVEELFGVLEERAKRLFEDNPALAVSSSRSGERSRFICNCDAFYALTELGPRALPSMFALLQEGKKYPEMFTVISAITKWRSNIYSVRDLNSWVVEEFPDMSGARFSPSAKSVWLRWWNDGRKQTPEWLKQRLDVWRAAVAAGNPKEAILAYERICDLGIAALPAMVERIKNGDEDLIPAFSRLSEGDLPREASAVYVENWWRQNREEWEIPDIEQPSAEVGPSDRNE